MPHDVPFEVVSDNHQPPGGQGGGGLLDLDEILGPNTGGGGGGGGQQAADRARRESFGTAGTGEQRLMGPERARSRDRRQSGSRRPRPSGKYYSQQGLREHSRRRNRYAGSSVDGDDGGPVFSDREEWSSVTSFYSDDAERLVPKRSSSTRRSSVRRDEPPHRYHDYRDHDYRDHDHHRDHRYSDYGYRDHHRRRPSDNSAFSRVITEPGRTPRRGVPERRQTMPWLGQRQISYPSKYTRGGDFIDEPLSPVVTQRSYSPMPALRRESRWSPPELAYPHELAGKDHMADDFMDAGGWQRGDGFREHGSRWSDGEEDDRDYGRPRRTSYVDHRRWG